MDNDDNNSDTCIEENYDDENMDDLSSNDDYEEVEQTIENCKHAFDLFATATWISCRADMISKCHLPENLPPAKGVIEYLLKIGVNPAGVDPGELAALEILIKDIPLVIDIEGYLPSHQCIIPLNMAALQECIKKYNIPRELLRPYPI